MQLPHLQLFAPERAFGECQCAIRCIGMSHSGATVVSETLAHHKRIASCTQLRNIGERGKLGTKLRFGGDNSCTIVVLITASWSSECEKRLNQSVTEKLFGNVARPAIERGGALGDNGVGDGAKKGFRWQRCNCR